MRASGQGRRRRKENSYGEDESGWGPGDSLQAAYGHSLQDGWAGELLGELHPSHHVTISAQRSSTSSFSEGYINSSRGPKSLSRTARMRYLNSKQIRMLEGLRRGTMDDLK